VNFRDLGWLEQCDVAEAHCGMDEPAQVCITPDAIVWLPQMTTALQINKYHLRTFGNGKVNEEFTKSSLWYSYLSVFTHNSNYIYLARSYFWYRYLKNLLPSSRRQYVPVHFVHNVPYAIHRHGKLLTTDREKKRF
jgi:hypothetical protein